MDQEIPIVVNDDVPIEEVPIIVERYPRQVTKPYNSSSLPSSAEINKRRANKNQLTPRQTVRPITLKSKKGYALILNHFEYDDELLGKRLGTDHDVRKLCEVFNHYNIEVVVKTDLKLCEIKDEVNNLRRKNFSDWECFIIVVMSHGDSNYMLHAKDQKYHFIKEIENPLFENESLLDKPKIIVIQACRGNTPVYAMDNNTLAASDKVCSTDERTISDLSTLNKRNIFKCNATYEGHEASRHAEHGTVFVQTFCDILKDIGETETITNVMQKVIHEVSTTPKIQQVPVFESTMTISFCFGSLRK